MNSKEIIQENENHKYIINGGVWVYSNEITCAGRGESLEFWNEAEDIELIVSQNRIDSGEIPIERVGAKVDAPIKPPEVGSVWITKITKYIVKVTTISDSLIGVDFIGPKEYIGDNKYKDHFDRDQWYETYRPATAAEIASTLKVDDGFASFDILRAYIEANGPTWVKTDYHDYLITEIEPDGPFMIRYENIHGKADAHGTMWYDSIRIAADPNVITEDDIVPGSVWTFSKSMRLIILQDGEGYTLALFPNFVTQTNYRILSKSEMANRLNEKRITNLRIALIDPDGKVVG